jgi:hypothetical protein
MHEDCDTGTKSDDGRQIPVAVSLEVAARYVPVRIPDYVSLPDWVRLPYSTQSYPLGLR